MSSVTLHVIERQSSDLSGESTVEAEAAVSARVVHHRVSWLADVSSSQVRTISAASGVDMSDIATTTTADKPVEDGMVQAAPALEDLLDARVLEYINTHKLYASTAPAATKSVGPPSQASRTVQPGSAPPTAPPKPTCARPSRRPVT